MPMSISRLSVGNPEAEQGLRSILEELGVPEGEDWTASVDSSNGSAAWEVVLDGPSRLKADHVDWEILQHEGNARYRRLLLGKDEQNLDYFKRSSGSSCGSASSSRTPSAHNPKLGEAFEETV